MSDFVPALNFMLDWEDPKREYQPVQDNNGAAVLSGINAKSWPIDFEEIAALPQESRSSAVATFYYKNFWLRWGVLMSAINSQAIASKLLDMAVNEGWPQAVVLAQRAVNRYFQPNVSVDGVLGPQTVQALNSSNEEVCLASICVECEQFYQDVVKHKPQYAVDLAGWLKRAHRIPPISA